MARTNKVVKSAPIYTFEGGRAKNISLEKQLERSVMSCLLFEDTFYEDGVAIADRIADLASKVDADTVDALAVKARSEGNLRHVPLWLTLALVKRKYPEVADTIHTVVQRPDEMAELLSMYWTDGKKPIPNQMKKGLAVAFTNFDAYQIQKYRGLGNAITLRDVMFLVHPKPVNKAMAKLYKQLADNELAAPETWEKKASAGEDQKEVFTSLIKEKKLGALAMLRNLRNMVQAGVPDNIIRQGLSQMNVERVLPFRFITASRYAPAFEPELEEAMFKCLALEDKLEGETHLLIDVSGSMDGRLHDKTEISRLDAACGVAMLLREICKTIKIFTFSDREPVLVPSRRGFSLRDAVVNSQSHSGTYLGNAVAKMSGYNRLIVITDEQSADRVPDPKTGLNYMINTAPYRNGVGYGPWVHIDGFSESTVRFIQELESEFLE